MNSGIEYPVFESPSVDELVEALRLRLLHGQKKLLKFMVSTPAKNVQITAAVRGLSVENGSSDTCLLELHDPNLVLGSENLCVCLDKKGWGWLRPKES